MAFKSNILNSLQPQYREYYRYKRGGENLTFEQRRLLDAVRDNPRPGQLQALSAYLVGAGGNSKVGEDALYNAGVALGATEKRVGDLWQRLSRVEDYVGFINLEDRPTEDYAANMPYATSRVPGRTQDRSEDLEVFGRKLPRTDEMAAVLPLMGDKYKEWYRTGSVQGWNVADIQRLDRAFADPYNPNWGEVASFSKYGDTGDFLRQVRLNTEDIVRSQEQVAEGAEEIRRREEEIANTPVPYYDPSRPSRNDVVMLTPSEAEKRGLVLATDEQMEAAGVYGPELPSVGDIARRYLIDQAGEGGIPSWLSSIKTTEDLPAGVRAPDGTTPSGDGGVGGGVPGDGGGYVDQTELDAAIPEDWKDAAREAYPAYYAIVKNIPEIAQLLQDAINKGYTDAQFQAELEQTNWWKQTTASAREWDINGERDPASQQTQIDNRTAFIQQTSLDTFGVRISAETASELALDSLRQGWGQQFLLNSIGDVATQSTAGISQLRAGFIGQDIRQTAYDYGIAISENTFNKFVNEIAVGKETKDTFQQYALTQAKNLFPSVAERLDAGETFQQIVDPYKQNAAALLEIDPDSIDFTSPDWAKAITYQDAKGEQRPMNFSEFNDYVRQTRSFGYEYTDQAKNKAYKVASELANLFGRI